MAGYLSAVPMIVGWLLVTFATSVTHLLIARFIMGISLSGINVFITMYVGEIAEDNIRGALGNLRGLFCDIGIIIVYLVAPYLTIHNTGAASLAIPVLFLFCYFWLPESPMFLMGKGDSEKALDAFMWLRGGDAKLAQDELSKLNYMMTSKSNVQEMGIKDLLSVRGTRKALTIALVLATVQQFSGMNVVFSYCETIFEMTGNSLSPYVSSIVFSLVNLLGSLCSCILADIAGRRLILITTQVLQGISLGSLGVYLFLRHLNFDVTVVGVLPLVCVSVYCFCVVAGPANMFYVVLSETLRPEARGIAMSITSSFLWLLAFLSTKFYSTLVDLLEPHGCFWLFTAVSFAGAIFTFFQIPETKNRSLESILRELNGDPPEDCKSEASS
ncbi:facilitated trehalose transporter Tret1-like isoform X4 [Periplaneta americana]